MNILFHTTTAICVAVLLADTKRANQAPDTKNKVLRCTLAFIVGIISHGVLDYIPHCYPINSKIDAIAGLTMILVTIKLTNKKYRLLMGLSLLGCIFPDLIDLSPGIINKLLGSNLPVLNKIFPWHLQEYSGSIYTGKCAISTLNHLLLLCIILIICWSRLTDFMLLFKKDKQ